MSEFETLEATAPLHVPDSIEPYIGYKYVVVDPDGQIRSLHNHDIHNQLFYWAIGERTEARCLGYMHWEAHRFRPDESCLNVKEAEERNALYANQAFGHHSMVPTPPNSALPNGYDWYYTRVRHEPADDDCSCGIYAVSSPKECANYAGTGGDVVLIKVALWGRVVIGENGARGQYAYPQEIYATKETRERVLLAGELYTVPVIVPEEAPEAIKQELKENKRKRLHDPMFVISLAFWVNLFSAAINLVMGALLHNPINFVSFVFSMATAGFLIYVERQMNQL